MQSGIEAVPDSDASEAFDFQKAIESSYPRPNDNPVNLMLDMLDMFYANKHMYDKLKRSEEKREAWREEMRKANETEG